MSDAERPSFRRTNPWKDCPMRASCRFFAHFLSSALLWPLTLVAQCEQKSAPCSEPATCTCPPADCTYQPAECNCPVCQAKKAADLKKSVAGAYTILFYN